MRILYKNIIIIIIVFFIFNLSPVYGQEKLKVGLVTGIGGLGDRSFNDMQYNGMIKAKKKLGISFEYTTPSSLKNSYTKLKKFARKNFDVIICGEGYYLKNKIAKIAKNYPDKFFILLDASPEEYPENLASITFKQNEGSFLVGYLASKLSSTNKIGVVAGDKFPVIEDFIIGYKSGAKYGNKNIKIYTEFVDNYINKDNVWDNPEIAKRISENLIKKHDLDVIYGLAAASNIGIFHACKKNNIYAIGVDSNQDYLLKGTVLTSMMKRLDKAIVFILNRIINDQFENKNFSLGLKRGGISLTPMKYTKDKVPKKVIDNVERIKKYIINNKITVPTFFKDK